MATRHQIELLASLQDLDLMIEELGEVEKLGFEVHEKGRENLDKARKELVDKLKKPFVGRYERLRSKYKRAIVPIRGDTCLGCFMKLPTYLITHAQRSEQVINCEGCGRIIYWLE